MGRKLPDGLKEEQELVPGGDLRIRGNSWLRNAFDDSQVNRVPRENEVRKVVRHLVQDHPTLCTLAFNNLTN